MLLDLITELKQRVTTSNMVYKETLFLFGLTASCFKQNADYVFHFLLKLLYNLIT